MDFRDIFILLGIVLVLASFYLGDWSIWLGAPIAFMGVILKYTDKGPF